MPGPSPSRRAFLGGLLTLAVAPASVAAPSGLTPLERTVEAVRRARLDQLHWRGTAFDILREIRPLHELSVTREQRQRLVRLAFLMARRDYLLETRDGVEAHARERAEAWKREWGRIIQFKEPPDMPATTTAIPP